MPILYHGTSAANLESIKAKGILPRDENPGNWSFKSGNPSIPNLVYLTDALAGYFATWCQERGDGKGLILEVDVPEAFLLPDEDFIRTITNLPEGFKVPKKTSVRQWMHLLCANANLWETSLKRIGTCSHIGAVEPHRITRAAIFDINEVWAARFDNSISPLAYMFSGTRLRQTMRLFFDGDYEVTSSDFISAEVLPPDMVEAYKKHMGLGAEVSSGLLPIVKESGGEFYELAAANYKAGLIEIRNRTVEVVEMK